MEEENMYLAFDSTHYHWKLRRSGYVRTFDELEHALRLLERNRYLLSTEITQRLIGVRVNREEAVIYEDIICWCGAPL